VNLPFHHQDRWVDSFFVIEGELEAMLAGTTHTVSPGTVVSVPRGVLHTINHRGPGHARILSLHTPDRGLGRQPAPRIRDTSKPSQLNPPITAPRKSHPRRSRRLVCQQGGCPTTTASPARE
jgi:uncharacterized cupin superfamily protein